ncbi:MAG TPA: metallopeptidase family protein, partial [Polyangiaceae bacterium]|nr:metallopeptidase family protein [Polyangiaceae bacterium]
EDMPSALDVEDGLDPRVLGVFCGASRDEQSHLDAGPEEPNVIKLYQRNLESMCGSRKELIEEIRVTLLHETAHFFGLEEEEIERLGLA